MYPIFRWVAISSSSIATSTCITLSAIAQSAPPPGVTIPPNAPDPIEQTIPNPSFTPRPLPEETPSTPPTLPGVLPGGGIPKRYQAQQASPS